MDSKKLKIIVIGASGTVGKEVAKGLEDSGHEVIRVSRNSGDLHADIQDKKSLENLFQSIRNFDAVANAAGDVKFGTLENFTDQDFAFSFGSKLMGQINIVRTALPYINDNGSFTLISGILTDEPIAGGIIGTTVNSAVEGFVKASSYELPRNIRINCISPTVLAEAEDYHPFFPGFIPVGAWKVAKAYEKSIAGVFNGRIIKV
ncbi:NADP-dependent 3-hydroxy acid dehydrogenase YdfG [Chryseobacterium soldanellicola]|uniref:NADP-dependent 3-hydroxy acid dehydrogenase YdfG n=1 Tax=Chryseobacterium soldanellicola TaxID=311333 RepID=A0A1H0YF47_9FLAO|nr:short chain dehydrogenase [Chryseobacterium soldanellicola]SDQ13845.1 NADP-dependent 3-hydroxy acid dehydrogenase YdfG [Chryseobacterium soldanellicola]